MMVLSGLGLENQSGKIYTICLGQSTEKLCIASPLISTIMKDPPLAASFADSFILVEIKADATPSFLVD